MHDALYLPLFIYGLGTVIALAAALLIKGIVGALSVLDRAPAAQPQHGAARPGAAPPVVAEGVPPHHLVAIAAAAHAMVGAHRIVHIGTAAGAAGWSTEGRLTHHASHHPAAHH